MVAEGPKPDCRHIVEHPLSSALRCKMSMTAHSLASCPLVGRAANHSRSAARPAKEWGVGASHRVPGKLHVSTHLTSLSQAYIFSQAVSRYDAPLCTFLLSSRCCLITFRHVSPFTSDVAVSTGGSSLVLQHAGSGADNEDLLALSFRPGLRRSMTMT